MTAPGVARTRRPLSLSALQVPRRFWWALLLVVVFHGALLLFGSYKNTYDAFVHIFLADHYDRNWFSTWDERWYTGFTTVSYPPGTHMAVAFISRFTGSLLTAFAFVQLSALLLLTTGMYRFSLLWVNREAAANAALLLAGSSAIAQTVHLYGQLPTTFALAFLLNAIPFMARWVDDGRLTDLIAGTLVMAACTAGHHVTTLFGSVFFLGPVVVAILLDHSRTPRLNERNRAHVSVTRELMVPLAIRRTRRMLPGLIRVGVLGFGALSALIIVVLPYWLWSSSDPIAQVPIPHGSRANFLADLNLGLIFFVIPWGFMAMVLPYALVRAVIDRMWPLAASIGLLAVLGTGGTTPIPKLLLGPAFDVLTLDRFTFWAVMLILPLGGLFVQSLEEGSIKAWLSRSGGPLLHRSVKVFLLIGFMTFTMFAATLAQYRPFQPSPIDTDPIVAFIEKDQHERWRFLTLGFGDQMAWLSAQTTATQVDGNYHSVRRLPELTSSSVERLEGAKYRGVSGLGSLQQFLEVPEKYNLKYVFSNDAFYDPLLGFLGWQNLGPLANGIQVWERNDIDPLPAQLPSREVPTPQRLMWGIIPPGAIVAGLSFLLWAVLGRAGITLTFARAIADRRTLFGPLGWIDRKLERATAKLDHAPPAATTMLARYTDRLAEIRSWSARPISKRTRRVRQIVLALIVLAIPLRVALAEAAVPTPEATVEAYYDDLDLRRFEDAYSRLDPITRPNYELWRLQLSVNGGLVSSYAKLDTLTTTIGPDRSRAGERSTGLVLDAPTLEATVDIRYLTSLDWHNVTDHHQMVERDEVWYIVAREPDITIPPEQLVSRADVEYLTQGRRQVTSLTTDLADIQDRPELALSNTRLIDVDGAPVLIGDVTNVDVDPADITLTGVLRDENGVIIARYNATEHFLRTLAPRESTTFRIAFEQVAAQDEVDFDPLAVTPLTFDDPVGQRIVRAEVWSKAVVTGFPIFRSLQLTEPVLTFDEDQLVLSGAARNDALVEATIPKVLVSFLNDAGEPLWVDRFYLDEAIRPQRTRDFSLTIDPPGVTETDFEVREFANNVNPFDGRIISLPQINLTDAQRSKLEIDLPGVTSLRIDLTAFTANGQ